MFELFKLEQVTHSTIDDRRSLVSFLIRLDARFHRLCSYATSVSSSIKLAAPRPADGLTSETDLAYRSGHHHCSLREIGYAEC